MADKSFSDSAGISFLTKALTSSGVNEDKIFWNCPFLEDLPVLDLEGFLWFLQKLPFETKETRQDKFALKLYKPTNLHTTI